MLFFLVIALSFVLTRADLNCLTWGVISPVAGIFCHLKHEAFNAVEESTVNNVKALASDVKESATDLLEFDVTHNPAYLAYEYVKTSTTQGSSAANSQLGSSLGDFVIVTIGFDKGVANMAYTVFELTFWGDFSYCLISNAAKSIGQSNSDDNNVTTRRKRANSISPEAGHSIAKACLTDKFMKISNAKVFNITDPTQSVGNTIAQVASFFVPVGRGAEAVEASSKIVLDSFDLVKPGAEDAGRIYKQVGTKGEAAHFASEEEALQVKQNLENESWIDENCVPAIPPVDAGATSRIRRRYQPSCRGIAASVACKSPGAQEAVSAGYTTLPDFEVADPNNAAQLEEARMDQFEFYDPKQYTGDYIPEKALFVGPRFSTYEHPVQNKRYILSDLRDYGTAVLAWSPDVTDALSSADAFKILKGVFTPTTAEEKAASELLEVGGETRKSFWGSSWRTAQTDNESVKALQRFTDGIETQCKQTVQMLKGWSTTDPDFQKLAVDVDYYYTPPTELAVANPARRGVRVRGGIMQMTASNTPGLVVEYWLEDDLPTYVRLKTVEKAWHLLKGLRFTGPANADLATHYTVFGPEMAQNGRITIQATAYVPLQVAT